MAVLALFELKGTELEELHKLCVEYSRIYAFNFFILFSNVYSFEHTTNYEMI